MKILGIDPGYGTIGFGIINKDKHKVDLVEYGSIYTPKEESVPVRLAILDAELKKIILKYKPGAIAVEELFFGSNTTTAIKVAQARGVILLRSIKHCGLIYEYTPLQVKMALTGAGRA
ncbi:MAG: crossover junction endodeoxyribonuclease RuvC, partial [Firmicutes bacterium]|nr:crossover junction endodeoxyribonuclease RuvC [Bacillota bacterium]